MTYIHHSNGPIYIRMYIADKCVGLSYAQLIVKLRYLYGYNSINKLYSLDTLMWFRLHAIKLRMVKKEKFLHDDYYWQLLDYYWYTYMSFTKWLLVWQLDALIQSYSHPCSHHVIHWAQGRVQIDKRLYTEGRNQMVRVKHWLHGIHYYLHIKDHLT